MAKAKANGSRSDEWKGWRGYFALKYYQYELWTAVYMLEPWEKIIFSRSILLMTITQIADSIVILSLVLITYASINYLPDYFSYFILILADYFPLLESYLPGELKRRLADLQLQRQITN
jgi:hypothetical protein